jgi:hypothetical protein
MSPTPPASSGAPGGLTEVRYSLPAMLRELDAERASGVFAMEKLDQLEIGKLFKGRKAPRRVKSRK